MVEKLIVTPFQKFVRIESFSGILLFSVTVIALLWANSPFSDLYHSLWNYKLGFISESFELNKPLILWINDGLMAIFFFLIGLEIKRELVIGELNTPKKASFPIFAAIGGVMVPVVIYLILNKNPETSHGWGIPMAADIAFVLAILKLLGNRIPTSLKVFLTAFAIIDDIAAVLVIAIFYSSSIKIGLIGIGLLILLALMFLAKKGIYAKYLIFFSGIIIWLLFLKAGIHPTVAGVLLAFAVPIRQKINVPTFTRKLSRIVKEIEVAPDNNIPILTNEQIEKIDNLEDWTDGVQSPLQHIEHKLHNWVAYFIMPVFALANAGVTFKAGMNVDIPLVTNIAISLFVGNSVGVTLMSFLTVRFKLTDHPVGTTKWHIIGAAFLAGVGFTMSIFISNLAFADSPEYIDSAKIGILIGSLISGTTGYIILKIVSKNQQVA